MRIDHERVKELIGQAAKDDERHGTGHNVRDAALSIIATLLVDIRDLMKPDTVNMEAPPDIFGCPVKIDPDMPPGQIRFEKPE